MVEREKIKLILTRIPGIENSRYALHHDRPHDHPGHHDHHPDQHNQQLALLSGTVAAPPGRNNLSIDCSLGLAPGHFLNALNV